MERTHISDEDEGKRVVNAKGDKIGMIKEVRNGTAYVDPDAGITDSIRSRLGWGEKEADDYLLESRRIDRVTDDEVQLKD
ncbi:PRC-barrel domain containing protein [Halorubellus litoreus]|uniref:PRC-barrel domain containing protein n=1 Tax=Halorubellus litoreus TaxID=755308 RepID=A0ABD5VHK5_9EURY